MRSNHLGAAIALAYAAGAVALAGIPLAANADAPRVTWRAPMANATLSGSISGSSCAVDASATVGMSRVTFWMDSLQINNDYSSPYNCSLDTRKLRDGTYTMRVDAYSSRGELTRQTRTVTIRNSGTTSTPTNTAPTVSITSPSANQSVSGTLSYAAGATDNAGVSRVEFRLDGNLINSDTSAPYGGSIAAPAAGSHTLTATAFDAAGLSSTSTVAFTVPTSTTTPTTPPPTTTPTTSLPAPTSGSLDVWFKAPLAGQTVSGILSNDKCYVKGTGVSRVSFSVDGSAIGADTNVGDGMSCTLDTTKLPNGAHTLTATAVNSSGATRSDVIRVNVQNTATTPPPPANTAPTVSITSPTANQPVTGTLAYAASASDDAGVTRVEFRLDGTLIGTDTTNSYGGSVAAPAPGTHTLTATAFDAAGLSSSSSVTFTVPSSTTPPSTGDSSGSTLPAPTAGSLDVWFKAPANGATVSGTLALDKCYVKGTGVSRVNFFVDGTAAGSDTNVADGMSCSLDTTKLANGTHKLTATAVSSTGASRSDVISINVQNTSTTTPTTPPPTTEPTTPPVTGTPSSLPDGGSAVATFQSLGLYWKPGSNPGAAGCDLQYRKTTETSWKKGLNMWYDSRNQECRGSVVHLQPGTEYEVQFGTGGRFTHKKVAKTWSEQFPIAQTITLPAGTVSAPVNITSGGSASGYVLYQAHPNGTTIDVQNAHDNNVAISAPYVIVRGVTMRNARINAVELRPGAHHVVIENNDISGWGRRNYVNSGGWEIGVDMDSAVRAKCGSASSINTAMNTFVVQRNRIHDPRYGANPWDWGHPAGPQGVTFSYCGGNHVIRYNEIKSANERHYFNDAISGEDNFTNTGFPNNDSDIYGNLIEGVMDDAIEAEGGNRNVRIWGNYLNKTGTGIASTVVATGPLYIFRNVYNQSRKRYLNALDADDRGPFFKAGSINSTTGDGRRYVLHNTALQASASGAANGLGAGIGIAGNTGQALTNTVTRNNIFHVWKSNWSSISQNGTGYGNDADYDLYNGAVSANSGAESNGVKSVPVYASGHGPASGSGGYYQLAPSSPGFDKGARLPNFNDDFLGAAPDMGATETGKPPMKFGIQ